MIDPAEFAEYEAWRDRKLQGAIDISIAAFNTEQEAVALAWEAGVRAYKEYIQKHEDAAAAGQGVVVPEPKNPYRAAGMMGAKRGASPGLSAPTAE